MNRVYKYLILNFLGTFSSLFSTLFMIISIIFFIQISRLTAYIEVSFSELAKLYLFMLPRILLFSLPISFFVSLSMVLFRLSKENELIVLFSLGHSPKSISKFFLQVSTFLSIALIFLALIFLPKASGLNSNFIEYKKTVAKLNLKTSEFGQKFAEWMIYVGSSNDKGDTTTYENVTMYNGNDLFIVADEARIINSSGDIKLELDKGKLYKFNKSDYTQSEFDNMTIRSNSQSNIAKTDSISQYWKKMATNEKRRSDFSTYVLVALFPLASTFFALSFGIVTYRYEKGIVYFGIFGVLFCYFAFIMLLNPYPLIAIPFVFLLFLLSGRFLFSKLIVKRY